jgi:hypothetical protein
MRMTSFGAMLAVGTVLVATGCGVKIRKIPVKKQILGASVRYTMANFSIVAPASWGPLTVRNQIGGRVAEQRIEFETPDRGRIIARSYGDEPKDSIENWITSLIEPDMNRKSIVVDGKPGLEYSNRNEKWVFVSWGNRILVVYVRQVDDQAQVSKVVNSIQLD